MILIALALLAANPATVTSVINGARAGDTVKLVAGRYSQIYIRNRTFVPALTIDASDASVSDIRLMDDTGIRIVGGTISGDPKAVPTRGYGVSASASRAITVTGVHFSDFRTGIALDRVDGAAISGNWFSRMSADGIDVIVSRNVVVDHNACSDFHTAPGSHPDCIQLWSRAGEPPVADVTITANSIVGAMQGIGLFNHVRDGVDDGGFDRIVVTDNTVLGIYAVGIAVYDCRGCTVRNNRVGSLPNFLNRPQLYTTGGSVTVCGNQVDMIARQSSPPCR